MKQITNKEYEEWQKYKAEKAKGHVLLPDAARFICGANGYDIDRNKNGSLHFEAAIRWL